MIKIPNIKGQTFAILGLGKTGLATAAALRASGAEAILWDDKETSRADAIKSGYRVEDLSVTDLRGVQALLLSPGIPHTHPAPHPAVTACKKAGLPIIGDIELLFRAEPKARYVGITGTNGKSTTTALIAHILREAKIPTEVGGNLGTPALSLAPLGEDGVYVLELSSYQLELIEQNSLNVAVLLNITPDHLDRHGGMEGYIEAKARIFTLATKPQTLVIGTEEIETRTLAARAAKQGNLAVLDIAESGLDKLIAPNALPALPGAHNWQNAQAALLACRALGVSDADILRGLKSFPGLAHRQQLVGEADGVRFINDSKATNADATSKALVCYDTIYWIIGGKPKEGGLSGLEPFTPRIRHAFIIGQASEDFANWCAKNNVAHTLCGTLDVATAKAAELAFAERKASAVVLLSPACASWDQFQSFEHRGDMFATLVSDITSKHKRAAS